jgi:peptidoglycan/xylan/chitin deacetylase (PgdA/CDA1 family)
MSRDAGPRFAWPRAARAAVSLTYDDAVPSQRGTAAKQLAAQGLVGTFFLTGNSADLAQHRSRWQALREMGHELASHTMHHPCDRAHAWVPEGYAVQDYTLPRMQAELEQTLELLRSLGAPAPHTFAYPCGETHVGIPPQSYVPLVKDLFLAARGIEPCVADPTRCDLQWVPAHDGARSTAELLALVDQAEAERGWLVLLFHGVGADHLPVSADAHAALLRHLAQRRDSIWTERFGAVAAHVRAERH